MRKASGILIMIALAIVLPPAAPVLAQQGQDLYPAAVVTPTRTSIEEYAH